MASRRARAADGMRDAKFARSAQERRESGSKGQAGRPACFRLLYESRDGRFCLFEDGHGHVTAVRAAKLA